MKKLALIIIVILILAFFLSADVYMKSVERTKPFNIMGKTQGEKVEIKEQWLAKNKFAQMGSEYSLIIDYDKEKLFLILHKPKIYYELPTDISRKKLLDLISSHSPKAAEIIKSTKISDVKVNINQETKKIANWNCVSSEFEMVFVVPALNIMPKYKIKMWTTKDLPSSYREYTQVAEEFFVKYILGMLDIDENSKKELEKLDAVEGFQVATEAEVDIFGTKIHVESQCLEVEEKSAPSGIYSVPKGYTKKTLNIPK